MIEVDHLTLQYPNGRGIRDVTFTVPQGSIVGYLGPNGSGKTTTIRCLLGFSRTDSGRCAIAGLDCSRKAPEIQKLLGYIPGEIAFLDGMSGQQFLNFLSDLRGSRDRRRMQELAELFEISLTGRIKKYSKGMKQKVGIIAAFMHDPQVLILDEPTSGLDPLMQNRFVELILQEKQKGKTILMSSHIFEEIEKSCDEVVIIKEGQIVQNTDIHALRRSQRKVFVMQLEQEQDAALIRAAGFETGPFVNGRGEVFLKEAQTAAFLKTIAPLSVRSLETRLQSLEDIFLDLYSREGENHESDLAESRRQA
ncbi:MAG: ABC transporter ATP-binding protein [Peptococcaceae bacterium]